MCWEADGRNERLQPCTGHWTQLPYGASETQAALMTLIYV